MATLPEHCHEILDRFFARDESYRTIAVALDVPMGTIYRGVLPFVVVNFAALLLITYLPSISMALLHLGH